MVLFKYMIWIRKYNCYTKITSEAWLHADLTLGKEEVRIFFHCIHELFFYGNSLWCELCKSQYHMIQNLRWLHHLSSTKLQKMFMWWISWYLLWGNLHLSVKVSFYMILDLHCIKLVIFYCFGYLWNTGLKGLIMDVHLQQIIWSKKSDVP